MKPEYREHIELVNKQIKELVGVYRDAVKHLDISESEFWVWYTLVAMEGPYTQQDICALWSLPKQTVNTVIAHMRLRRYATLEFVPRTRNHKIIRLTAEGRKFGEKLVQPISQVEHRAFSIIDPEELKMVTRAFGKYIDIIREEMNVCKDYTEEETVCG